MDLIVKAMIPIKSTCLTEDDSIPNEVKALNIALLPALKPAVSVVKTNCAKPIKNPMPMLSKKETNMDNTTV